MATALKWLMAGLLTLGLFTGMAYVLTPLVTNGWGNEWTLLVGFALILICGAALNRLDPRGGRHAPGRS